jgi:hypothetical protein
VGFNQGDPVRLASTVSKYVASPGPKLIERNHPNYYVPADLELYENQLQPGSKTPVDYPLGGDWEEGGLTYNDAHPGKVLAELGNGKYRIRLYYPILRR